MLAFLPTPVKGVISLILFSANIIIMPTFVILVGILKWLIPIKQTKSFFWNIQNNIIPSLWIDINSAILSLVTDLQWEVSGEGNLTRENWYFVIANHRSWADIMILQKIFNRKIPTLKFFLKQELLWTLPLGGLCCWMLGFPFMKRHSKAYLKKHPEMKGKDIETTRKACEEFKKEPTAVVNFLEGTRFTEAKRASRTSPFTNLLRPKAGGFAFVTATLKEQMKDVVDVTIVYSDIETPSFWEFISGKVKKVNVSYRVLPIPEDLHADYYGNVEAKRAYQSWINNLWHEKDRMITEERLKGQTYDYQEA